jgi:hypothetical protein
MSFRNASELVHSSSPLSGVRSEPGFGSTWESVQRAHRRWSKKDDAQKDVFCENWLDMFEKWKKQLIARLRPHLWI